MIVFHEGLPGAGKSYETCVEHIIPALFKGRKVFAYIEGLNHEKFSEVTLIPEKMVKDYLIQITREQVPEIYKHVEKDSLVVIDELQNFWPAQRQKPDDEIMRFVTEHRHQGLDIICMGQDLRDCHSLWKRRVEQKVVFTKLTAVGRDNSYKWMVYRALSGENFQKISSGIKNYDKKYFGLYASYEEGAKNTKTYADKRAVIWNNPVIKYGIPIFLVVLFYAVKYLIGFFSPPVVVKPEESQLTNMQTRPGRPMTGTPGNRMEPNQEPEEPKAPPPIDQFDEMAEKYRARLVGVADFGNGNQRIYIDVLDTTFHVKDRYTIEELKLMGWQVERLGKMMVKVSKENKTHLVRNWPIDPFGRVSDSARDTGELKDEN